jgi:protein-tyrosine-phosphatase
VESKHDVLFLCTHNGARSQMEQWIKARLEDVSRYAEPHILRELAGRRL